MLSYYIWTIGCQMNRAESERIAALLESRGYRSAPDADSADLVVVNSCVVRASAENRVTNKLMALKVSKQKNPARQLALTGCFVPEDAAGIRKKYPFVDYVFQAGADPSTSLPGSGGACSQLPEQATLRSLVPIIQGCNNFCSYCIVPYRRGRERSRDPAEVESEVRTLVERGAREVVLLGQNVDSYGQDLPGKPDLASLLERLNAVNGLRRLRFLTNHPKDMSSRLIQAVAGLDKVCEQVNLPLQAGDNRILEAMKRGYTVEQFRNLVAELRRAVPGIAVTTDVITGFPGEDSAAFEATAALVEQLQFDAVHIAMYSPREQTLAASVYTDDVPAAEKKRRAAHLEALQTRISADINSGLVGRDLEVLVEGRKKGKWFGRSRTDKPVFFEHSANWSGTLATVKITYSSPWSLQGRVV